MERIEVVDLITLEIAAIKKDMPKNKVKKFSIVDKKLKKFRNENHVQPNDKTVRGLRKCSQADKRV
tara:strand:+ start:97 stop:294 length:198 start_codon:yes stop_codon:yes gene_type:complete